MQFKGKAFNDEKVTLDNNEFENCRFQNCTVIYSGSNHMRIDECIFDGCEWVLAGAAENTLRFMTTLYQIGGGGKVLIEDTFDKIRSGGPKGGASAPKSVEKTKIHVLQNLGNHR